MIEGIGSRKLETDSDRMHLLIVHMVGAQYVCALCRYRDEPKGGEVCFAKCTYSTRSHFTPRDDARELVRPALVIGTWEKEKLG